RARDRLRRAARAAGAVGGRVARDADDPLLGDVVERTRVSRSVEGDGVAERARAEAADLRAVGRVGGGPDDVAARRNRRPPQLGLSVLLDSRLELSDRRAVAARLSRRSAGALLVVHAGDGADGAAAAGVVPARRRRTGQRIRTSIAQRV